MTAATTDLELGFSTGEFSAAAIVGDGTIDVVFAGNADMRAAPGLEELVPKIHEHARRLNVGEVAVDVGGLEFMNASCFRVFINWLGAVRALPEDERYIVRFLAAAGRHWQRPSLSALTSFAAEVVVVDTLR